MNWFTGNTDLINAVTNIGTLLVWLIYAQLLYLNFARQRHPTLLINQVQGYGLHSSCMISNMSREPIHIECVIVKINRGDQSTYYNVADEQPDADNQSVHDLRSLTHQGPLESSGYSSLGMFEKLIRRALTEDGRVDILHADGDFDKILSDIESIEIRVVADYGPETWLVAAFKRFLVQHKETGETFIFPERFGTDQLIGFWARRYTIPKWLKQCMPERIT